MRQLKNPSSFFGKVCPLGPLGFNSPNIAQRHALHLERTAEKAVMLSDRVELSSAEARVEEIKGGSVGVFELSHPARARTHQAQVSQGTQP